MNWNELVETLFFSEFIIKEEEGRSGIRMVPRTSVTLCHKTSVITSVDLLDADEDHRCEVIFDFLDRPSHTALVVDDCNDLRHIKHIDGLSVVFNDELN